MISNPLRDTTVSRPPMFNSDGEQLFVRDSPRVSVELAGLTHPGTVRPNNEDNYAVIRRARFQEVLLTSQSAKTFPVEADNAHLFLMADGMGGAAFGELASSLAIRSLWSLSEQCSDWIMKISEFDPQLVKQRVDAYTQEVQNAMRETMATRPQSAGMGTTLTGVYVMGLDAIVVQIGDSRAYLYRAGKLRRLTRDHTVAEQLTRLGMSEDLAHSFRHMITSCLGGDSKSAHPDIDYVRLAPGDLLLLATDGLTDVLSDDAIAARLVEQTDLKVVCQALVDDALMQAAPDNVSVVLARFSELDHD
jgi:PPM family protein phosphatase